MESESTVERGINFIFCLGTAYDLSSMESFGSSKSFSLVGKVCLSKKIISQFLLWALAPLQISASHSEGPTYLLYAIFIFIWVSIFSYKAPTREHYDHTWALDVANIRVSFVNGAWQDYMIL